MGAHNTKPRTGKGGKKKIFEPRPRMLHERVLERARTATRLSRAPPSEKSAPKQTLRSERATHESLAPVNCADVSPIFSKRTPPSPFASRAVSEETNQTAVEDVPCEDALAQGTCESDKRLEDGGKDCLHGGKRRMTNIKAEAEATFLSRNAWSDERHGTICDGDDEGEWSLCVVLPDSVRPVYRFALTVVSKSSGITRWYTEMCLAHGYLSYAGASKHARHIVVERYSAHDDDRATPPPTDTVSTPLTVADAPCPTRRHAPCLGPTMPTSRRVTLWACRHSSCSCRMTRRFCPATERRHESGACIANTALQPTTLRSVWRKSFGHSTGTPRPTPPLPPNHCHRHRRNRTLTQKRRRVWCRGIQVRPGGRANELARRSAIQA